MWYKGFNPTQRLSKNSCLKFFFSFCFYGLSVLFFKVIYVACNRTKSFFRWPALVNIITSCSSSPPFLFLTAPVTGSKRRATSYRDRKQEAVGVWRGGWFPGAGRETETPPISPSHPLCDIIQSTETATKQAEYRWWSQSADMHTAIEMTATS